MTVYIVDLEAVETRYTAQWKEHLPKQLQSQGVTVEIISGGEVPQATTPGAFLNFAGTNSYKSQQLQKISEMFAEGTVKNGDYFLYTDAWNPTVIQVKYMAELLGVKVRLGGMWHAGSYDPQDFLGRLIGDKPWVRNAECSMFYCFDDNFFATRFHANMFLKELLGVESMFTEDELEEWQQDSEVYGGGDPKIHIVGWPMEYLTDLVTTYLSAPKKDKIIFPHRLAPEKQVEIFRDLAKEMPEYEWFVAQDQTLTKDEYHQHMAESRLMFSANLQETLGISAYEAALVGTLPVLPRRLSYEEMWNIDSFYPSEWTLNWDSYQTHKEELKQLIRFLMNETNWDIQKSALRASVSTGYAFFNGYKLYNIVKNV
jgi:hypothetical protein